MTTNYFEESTTRNLVNNAINTSLKSSEVIIEGAIASLVFACKHGRLDYLNHFNSNLSSKDAFSFRTMFLLHINKTYGRGISYDKDKNVFSWVKNDSIAMREAILTMELNDFSELRAIDWGMKKENKDKKSIEFNFSNRLASLIVKALEAHQLSDENLTEEDIKTFNKFLPDDKKIVVQPSEALVEAA